MNMGHYCALFGTGMLVGLGAGSLQATSDRASKRTLPHNFFLFAPMCGIAELYAFLCAPIAGMKKLFALATGVGSPQEQERAIEILAYVSGHLVGFATSYSLLEHTPKRAAPMS